MRAPPPQPTCLFSGVPRTNLRLGEVEVPEVRIAQRARLSAREKEALGRRFLQQRGVAEAWLSNPAELEPEGRRVVLLQLGVRVRVGRLGEAEVVIPGLGFTTFKSVW